MEVTSQKYGQKSTPKSPASPLLYFFTSHFTFPLSTLNFSTFKYQNVSLNPSCTVRGAYDRLGLETGWPYPGLVSVTLYVEKS